MPHAQVFRCPVARGRGTLTVERHPDEDTAAFEAALSGFADLVCPTVAPRVYRLTAPLIWRARRAGLALEEILQTLGALLALEGQCPATVATAAQYPEAESCFHTGCFVCRMAIGSFVGLGHAGPHWMSCLAMVTMYRSSQPMSGPAEGSCPTAGLRLKSSGCPA